MRSIDNLREYALTAASVNATTKAVLAGYIDNIEREVEELRDRDYRNGREDAEGAVEFADRAVEFADRLCRASERREDVTLWGVDYTPLPVDADGVPIHVGDVLEWTSGDTLEVIGFGGETLFYIDKNHNDSLQWTQASTKHHHHVPTVEDVLREMLDALDIDRCDDPDGTIAEYAARLRLAEGVDA